jgi:recombinational DNA repair protein (RecF pathway)
MYVNELTYKLIPTGLMDIEFYGCYMSTLIQLNLPENMQQALRFFEMKLLALNGSSIDFQSDARNAPIEHDKRYSFESSSGFKSSKTGRYTGQLVIGAGNLDSSIQGALAVARECLALQIDALLEGQSLVSRQWRLPKT